MPGAASLDHNDLHPWNMLSGADGFVFYDWGDSVVAHPFVSMYLPLAFAQRQLGAALDDPRLLHLRDAYLNVFSDVAPYEALVAVLELACHVGKVARAMTWQRAMYVLGPDDCAEFAGAPLSSLSHLRDASYLAGGGSY